MTPLLPGPGELALFAAAAAVLNAKSGVDFLLTVTRTLQGGARAGLGWLGQALLRQAWRGPAVATAADAAAAPAPARSLWLEFRSGLLTNLLNPKVALFFLAFLPQFVPAAAPDKAAAFLLLGGWFALQGTVFLALLVLLTARLSRWRATLAVRRALGALGGTIFFALALRLLGARPALG